MKISTARTLSIRFMKRIGYLVSWIETRRAYETDNIILRDGMKLTAVAKIKL